MKTSTHHRPLLTHKLLAGEGGDGSREMNLGAVDAALDDVRPYLMADGGNVTVVEVADGVVRLRLEVRITEYIRQTCRSSPCSQPCHSCC